MRNLCYVLSAIAAGLIPSVSALAEGCNIADVLFGKVRIELIPNKEYKFETGIVFGNDFDSKRFSYGKILGSIRAPERDGSRRVDNVNGDLCGIIEEDLTVDTSDSSCTSCNKAPFVIKRLSPKAYAIIEGGTIRGTIEGRLPNAP